MASQIEQAKALLLAKQKKKAQLKKEQAEAEELRTLLKAIEAEDAEIAQLERIKHANVSLKKPKIKVSLKQKPKIKVSLKQKNKIKVSLKKPKPKPIIKVKPHLAVKIHRSKQVDKSYRHKYEAHPNPDESYYENDYQIDEAVPDLDESFYPNIANHRSYQRTQMEGYLLNTRYKNFNLMEITEYTFDYYPLTESTCLHISKVAINLIKIMKRKVRNTMSQGSLI
ncbi:MAG: hypothetical protein P4L31_06410 [Candidatus Babeliales bacterium]|nr:hypothetical protein [Candidatus Babeliales bacterium]